VVVPRVHADERGRRAPLRRVRREALRARGCRAAMRLPLLPSRGERRGCALLRHSACTTCASAPHSAHPRPRCPARRRRLRRPRGLRPIARALRRKRVRAALKAAEAASDAARKPPPTRASRSRRRSYRAAAHRRRPARAAAAD
jgi:hypothetical protein